LVKSVFRETNFKNKDNQANYYSLRKIPTIEKESLSLANKNIFLSNEVFKN